MLLLQVFQNKYLFAFAAAFIFIFLANIFACIALLLDVSNTDILTKGQIKGHWTQSLRSISNRQTFARSAAYWMLSTRELTTSFCQSTIAHGRKQSCSCWGKRAGATRRLLAATHGETPRHAQWAETVTRAVGSATGRMPRRRARCGRFVQMYWTSV